MTCPRCREEGLMSPVELAERATNARAVEEQVRFRCPTCGWLSEVFAL